MVRQLQMFRPIAESFLPGEPNSQDPPLAVIVFRQRGDFRRALGSGEMTAFMQPSFTENLMVVGPDPQAYARHESLLHEYVHYLLRTRMDINIPSWFDEGLASMLSTTELEDGEAVLGALPERGLDQAIRESRLSLEQVLEAEDMWDWHRDRRSGFYAWSWVLTHRLMLGQEFGRRDLRPGLRAFLADRQPTLTEAVGISDRLLERRLLRYLKHNPLTVTRPVEAVAGVDYEFACVDEAEKVRQLSLAVVHQNPEAAVRHLRPQIEQHPDDAALWTTLSLAEEAGGDREAAVDAARRAVALAPDDVSATVRLAGALVSDCVLQASESCRGRWQEAVPLLRRSLRRDPHRQDAIFILGLAYLYSGRAGDALNYLRIAHQRQPWAPHVNFYLGETYRLVGDTRAREHLSRARRWSPTLLWRKMAEAGLELLQDRG